MSTTETPSLYQKLGGRSAVEAVVSEFYARVLDDDALAPFFVETDMERQFRHQVAFVSLALSGPSEYTGRSMRQAHQGLGIEDPHFDAVAGHLQGALECCGVEAEDVRTILGVVGGLRDDVVGR